MKIWCHAISLDYVTGGNGSRESFFFHVVLPLTISSFLRFPLTCSRCVYLKGHFSNGPKSIWPSKISEVKENPLSRLMSFPSFIASSSGSQRDCTISELPHSLLYSSVILESWWFSKNKSGIVWRNIV